MNREPVTDYFSDKLTEIVEALDDMSRVASEFHRQRLMIKLCKAWILVKDARDEALASETQETRQVQS